MKETLRMENLHFMTGAYCLVRRRVFNKGKNHILPLERVGRIRTARLGVQPQIRKNLSYKRRELSHNQRRER